MGSFLNSNLIPLVRPRDTHHYPTADRRTETVRLTLFALTFLRTILMLVEAKGVLNAVGPVRENSQLPR